MFKELKNMKFYTSPHCFTEEMNLHIEAVCEKIERTKESYERGLVTDKEAQEYVHRRANDFFLKKYCVPEGADMFWRGKCIQY